MTIEELIKELQDIAQHSTLGTKAEVKMYYTGGDASDAPEVFISEADGNVYIQ